MRDGFLNSFRETDPVRGNSGDKGLAGAGGFAPVDGLGLAGGPGGGGLLNLLGFMAAPGGVGLPPPRASFFSNSKMYGVHVSFLIRSSTELSLRKLNLQPSLG